MAVKGDAVERVTGVSAVPSTVNVTVPVGAVDRVFGATVAVKVTDLTDRQSGSRADGECRLGAGRAYQGGKRRRQLVRVDRPQSTRLVIPGSGRIANHGV